tara:strand:- start:77 stop:367 length:291 start_codon:yes stop_codon:yes gene_type:complete
MSNKLLLSFEILQKSFKNLENRTENISENKLEILRKKIDELDEEINNIIIESDKQNNVNLSVEDIERIEIDEEANKIFKAFFPYMLIYSLSIKENT